MSDLPHGTVTFLFTDIEGSTRLWQAHREGMDAAYARHDAILREAIARHGGVVYKVIGDAFQVAFATAPQATAAGLQAQQALQAEPWDLPEPLRVRMALHTGAVDPDPGGNYRSPVLNRLGRLLSAGHGGQVLLSAVTYELVRDHLPAGAALRDLGPHRLRDLYRPERVYQLTGTGLAATFPLLRTLDVHPNNLPIQPTPFIGREAAVAEARAMLIQTEVRLVTLTGPGGMGKTRLALQTAADLLERFADGVWFVDLAPVADPDLVASTIASTLGVEESGDQSLTAVLTAHLGDKEVLLVLDNFEQVVGAAPLVGELRAECPHLTVMVTSRIRLGLRGEYEFPVSPLTLPDPRQLPSIDRLNQYEAVRLFVGRALEARPDFAVTNANAPAVAAICVRLDGLPLAIELAAARIRMLPPPAMLKRLQDRLPLLTGGSRDLPLRQQTLRGTIAWSYDLLEPDEQALFRRLAVFAGGFTIEAAEAVAAGDELDLQLFDSLERLVEHSLVRQTETEGEPRFSMLETIREFGLEQLETTGEAEEAQERHAACFLRLAEQAEPELTGPRQRQCLNQLEIEHDNLRAAMDWTLEHAREVALRLAAALWRFWYIHAHFTEGRVRLRQTLVAAATTPNRARAMALHGGSVLAAVQGELDRTKVLATEALECYQLISEQTGLAHCLNTLGDYESSREGGSSDRAAELYQEALDTYRAAGHTRGVAVVLTNLGNLAWDRGDNDQATSLHEEALTLYRQTGDERGVAWSLTNLGVLDRERAELQSATALLKDALSIYLALGDRNGVAEALEALGSVMAIGAKAACLLGAAEALRQSIGTALSPAECAMNEQIVEALHTSVGMETFAAAWAAGRRLSMEQAVTVALTSNDGPAYEDSD